MPAEHHLQPYGGYWNYGPLSQHTRGTSLYPWTQLSLISNAMMDLRRQIELIDHYMRRYGLDKRRLGSLCPPMKAHVKEGKYSAIFSLGANTNPEDIKITLKNHMVTVEVKREEKAKDGNSRYYQELMRKFTLPEKVDEKEVKSFLSSEGDLHIEAPLPALTSQEKEELESELTSEGFVDVQVQKGKREGEPPDPDEVDVPVNVEEKPSGCVNN